MKIFKPYILSILTLLSAAPMGAMQVEQKQAKVAYTINPDLIKKIETEVNAIATDVVNSIKKIITGQAGEINALDAAQRLNTLINALPLPMNELKQALIKFRKGVEDFGLAISGSSNARIVRVAKIEDIGEAAKHVNEVTKEIEALLQKAAQIDELSEKLGIKKTVATTPVASKSASIDESQKNEVAQETKTTTPIAPILQNKEVKPKAERKPIITRNRVLFTVAGLAGLVGLGYAAYNYFRSQTTPPVAPAIKGPIEASVTPVLQATVLAKSATMGQNIYQWLAGNAINPWH